VARTASRRRGRAETIHTEVRVAVSGWSDFADRAGVDDERAERIRRSHRLEL
jgi:serine/threonine-protein kinase HipA